MNAEDQHTTEECQQARRSEQFEQAYVHYQERLARYIRFLIGNKPKTIEDILADTFVRARRNSPKRQLPNVIESDWLYRIARNLCFDYLRGLKRVSARFVEHTIYGADCALARPIEVAANLVADSDGTHDPERMVLAREALEDALGKIAPKNRLAVVLAALGVPSREITDLLVCCG